MSSGSRGSTEAHLSKEVRSGTAGHVVAPKPFSAERCSLKLQFTWQRVNARTTPYLNLKLVCGAPDLYSADEQSNSQISNGATD
jgi:hypothetical protein